MCYTAVFLSALLCSVHMDTFHTSSVHVLCHPTGQVLFCAGLMWAPVRPWGSPISDGAVGATGGLFGSQSPFSVSALSPAVLRLWSLGESWGGLPMYEEWAGGNL